MRRTLRHPRLTYLAPVAIAALFAAPNARAAAPTCPSLDVGATPEAEERWPAIESEVRDAFAKRDDVDRCAHVMLAVRGGEVLVEVTLPDGRSTARAVARREDVLPALEALLLVPVPDVEPVKAADRADDGTPPHAETPLLRVSIGSSGNARDVAGAPVRKRPDPASPLRFEISALAGARVGDGQLGVGIGAQSLLDASRWLVGFGARADGYRALGVNETAGAGVLEVALLGGRRVWLGRSVTWDFLLGPAAMIQGTSTYEAHTPNGDVSASSSGMLPRLLTGMRLTFGARSVLRSFVGVDGELGPTHRDDDVPTAPRLPLWTLGLAMGATVGTL